YHLSRRSRKGGWVERLLLSGTLLAYVPELGNIPDKTLASLIGVAPHPRDSGMIRRKRTITAGRSQVVSVVCGPSGTPLQEGCRCRHRHSGYDDNERRREVDQGGRHRQGEDKRLAAGVSARCL